MKVPLKMMNYCPLNNMLKCEEKSLRLINSDDGNDDALVL
jgi:hypothetical protein